MNETKKQIEEMAQFIDSCETKTYKQCLQVANYIIEKLHYRKIKNNEVVMSDEDYNNLIERAEYAERELSLANNTINRLKKYDEERDIALHARLKAETRKETAKEILNRLYEQINETDPKWFGTQIKIIAKHFGVEVEE